MKLTKLKENLVREVIILLSYVVPKKKGFYLFIPRHNRRHFLSGNIKALFSYLQENSPHLQLQFLSTRNSLPIPDNIKNITLKEGSVKTMWQIIRAEHLILDMELDRRLISFSKTSVIQLWHGAGYKNIALLSDNFEGAPEEYKKNIKRLCRSFKLVSATSAHDAQKKNDSFKTDKSVITGSPRNDMFFETKAIRQLKKRYELDGFDRIVTYAPTFRDRQTFAPFSNSFWSRLNEVMVEQNAIFLVKKHPWDQYLNVPENFSNIKDFSSKIADVQELLIMTDLLISDYSGIVSDYVITNRPVLIYAYDREDYINNCRSMYYDIDEVLLKPFTTDEDSLLEKIKNDSWTQDDFYIENYEAFRNRFNKYLDGNSSERVANAIKNLS